MVKIQHLSAIAIIATMTACVTGDTRTRGSGQNLTQTQREEVGSALDSLVKSGVLDRYTMGAAGTVRAYAGPSWGRLTAKEKSTACAALIAHFSSEDARNVRIINRDNKTIASYNGATGYRPE